jgi:hypothetical protein
MAVLQRKRVVDVVPADFDVSPVWRYSGSDPSGEVLVAPVRKVPVSNGAGKVFGTRVTLAHGTPKHAMLSNVGEAPRLTAHFLTLSVFVGDRWFHLARYHDVARDGHGPDALARILGLSVPEVFPIAFDVSDLLVSSRAESARGFVDAEPRERLSGRALMKLIVSENRRRG